jgi:hypothetical protein
MSTEDTIIVRKPSSNPWLRGPEACFPRADAEHLARVVVDACDAVRHLELKNSYNYDKYVYDALKGEEPEDAEEKLIARLAVIKVLREMGGQYDTNWYFGPYAAHRVLNTWAAYATPGFAEARNASSFANGG